MPHPLAGKPAPRELLVDPARVVAAYASERPDPTVPEERVAFGTSGHRGAATRRSFNEAHVLAIVQAVCEYRAAQGIAGPLFLGMDTHALSAPAHASALEVLAANGVETRVARGGGFTATPLVSHAILRANRGKLGGERHADLADGLVITPSHNPPTTAASNTTRPTAAPPTRTPRAGSRPAPTP